MTLASTLIVVLCVIIHLSIVPRPLPQHSSLHMLLKLYADHSYIISYSSVYIVLLHLINTSYCYIILLHLIVTSYCYEVYNWLLTECEASSKMKCCCRIVLRSRYPLYATRLCTKYSFAHLLWVAGTLYFFHYNTCTAVLL